MSRASASFRPVLVFSWLVVQPLHIRPKVATIIFAQTFLNFQHSTLIADHRRRKVVKVSFAQIVHNTRQGKLYQFL
jgi:hypothetical protein